MKPLLVGASWKMHLTSSQARDYFLELRSLIGDAPDPDVFVLPPFTSLWVAREMLDDTTIKWGAQDVHPDEEGEHTGDISAAMLVDLGCRFVELGHAERRRDHDEGPDLIAAKLERVVRSGLVPILCVGEPSPCATVAAADYVRSQLCDILRSFADLDDLVVAYEPVWAIGHGATVASPERVVAIHAALRQEASAFLATNGRLRIIYGGSVDEEAASWLIGEDEVDGVFVGRAALDPNRFAAIVRTGAPPAPLRTAMAGHAE